LKTKETKLGLGVDFSPFGTYIIYVSVKKELIMFAVVDFDRQKSFFFTDFQSASDFITQYPVIDNVVVVDLSEGEAACEQL
jgi:hypothetical protein